MVPIVGARCTISQGVLLDIYHETRYLVRIAGRYDMIASDIRYGECSHSSRAQVKLHKTGTPGMSLFYTHPYDAALHSTSQTHASAQQMSKDTSRHAHAVRCHCTWHQRSCLYSAHLCLPLYLHLDGKLSRFEKGYFYGMPSNIDPPPHRNATVLTQVPLSWPTEKDLFLSTHHNNTQYKNP